MENSILQALSHHVSVGQSIWLFVMVFLGGVISSLSPCSLGLLPVVVGYVGGYSENIDRKVIFQVFLFVLGLSLVLTTFGIVSALTGQAFGFHSSPIWALLIASLILVMGLSLIGVLEIPVPVILKSLPQNKNNNVLYPLLLGGAFAFATTPCSTPLLAGIIAYTSLKSNIFLGGMLLLLFSLGQGVVLIIAGLFTSVFKKATVIRSFSGHFVKFSGVVLIFAAIIIYLKLFGIV